MIVRTTALLVMAVSFGLYSYACRNAVAQTSFPTDAEALLRMAAEPPSGTQGESWSSISQLPDWVTGVWAPAPRPALVIGTNGVEQNRFATNAPLTAKWRQLMEDVQKIADEGGDVPGRHKNCIPEGFGGGFGGGTPGALMEVEFTPGRVTFIPESNYLRRIYTDGREHPADPDLTFYGHSIGHWKGTALIVDTVGLDPGNEMIYGIPIGKAAHIVERISLETPNRLQQIAVVEAPESLTKLWLRSTSMVRHTDWDMMESYCTQNNRGVSSNGEQFFDLTPP